MNYFKHQIKKDGWIVLHEKTDNDRVHTKSVAPNQPIPKEYKQEIESDPDFEKYRTQENADAYEARLEEEKPTQEEIDERESRRQLKEKREQAKQELKESRPPQSNPELAKRVEKLEFAVGIREGYTE